jgi:hypothetical protein
MSMLCQLLALTPRQVETLQADPDLAEEIAFADGDEAGDLQPIFDEPLAARLELEHSWDVLRVLLDAMDVAGTDRPAKALIFGEAMGEDVGYGPARLRTAAETEQFARFLQSVELDHLLSRMSYAEIAKHEIYRLPQTEERLRAVVSAYFPSLRDYVARAAAAKQGLLVWLS